MVYYQLTAYGQFNASDLFNIESNITAKGNTSNTLKIFVDPIGFNGIHYGNVTIIDGDEYASLTLNINAGDLICNEGSLDCITFDQCLREVLLFKLSIINCNIAGAECINMYPSNWWISIGRSSELCSVAFPTGGSQETEIPDYIWWVMIVLLAFAVIAGWLIYDIGETETIR